MYFCMTTVATIPDPVIGIFRTQVDAEQARTEGKIIEVDERALTFTVGAKSHFLTRMHPLFRSIRSTLLDDTNP